jgi:hypothetical protein
MSFAIIHVRPSNPAPTAQENSRVAAEAVFSFLIFHF